MIFKELLKQNIESAGLDYKIANRIYSRIFKTIRDLMRSETHKYYLRDYVLSINVPFLGNFMTRDKCNKKEYKKQLKK